MLVLISLVCLMFSPESPRYLVEVGRPEEGRKVLARLHGQQYADQAMAEIQAAVALEHAVSSDTTWATIFENNKQCFRYRTLLCMGVNFFQQATGINIAVSPTFFFLYHVHSKLTIRSPDLLRWFDLYSRHWSPSRHSSPRPGELGRGRSHLHYRRLLLFCGQRRSSANYDTWICTPMPGDDSPGLRFNTDWRGRRTHRQSFLRRRRRLVPVHCCFRACRNVYLWKASG